MSELSARASLASEAQPLPGIAAQLCWLSIPLKSWSGIGSAPFAQSRRRGPGGTVRSCFHSGNGPQGSSIFCPCSSQAARKSLGADTILLCRRSTGDEAKLVDEFKGRIAENRRWAAGLQLAVEAKENLPLKRQGRILGSITLENLAGLYPRICGMTDTAATQAEEVFKIYGLEVVAIPTNRPVIRVYSPKKPTIRFFRQIRAGELTLVPLLECSRGVWLLPRRASRQRLGCSITH